MDEDFFSILSCPICKRTLIKDKYGKFLYCEHCDIEYPIKGGIPDLRIDEEVEKALEKQKKDHHHKK